MNFMKSVCSLALLFTLCVSTTAFAHDMWLEKRGDRVFLEYGHPGKTDPYPMSRIQEMKGITQNMWEVALEPIEYKGKAFAHIDDEFALLAVSFDNWYWYNTEEDGWRQFRRPSEVRGTILEEGRSYKLAKEILAWQPFLAKPIGQRAEIVPLKNPVTLKEGDKLPVMLYYEGNPMPAEGARVSGTSDSKIEHPEKFTITEGKPYEVTIGPAGRQIITGNYEKKLGDNKHVWYAFSLTFTTSK